MLCCTVHTATLDLISLLLTAVVMLVVWCCNNNNNDRFMEHLASPHPSRQDATALLSKVDQETGRPGVVTQKQVGFLLLLAPSSSCPPLSLPSTLSDCMRIMWVVVMQLTAWF